MLQSLKLKMIFWSICLKGPQNSLFITDPSDACIICCRGSCITVGCAFALGLLYKFNVRSKILVHFFHFFFIYHLFYLNFILVLS